MLLGRLLTLLLVSSQCVSDIHNSTFSKYRCEFTSMCCTRDFVNIPVAITPKLTSQASVPDRCFPFEALIYRFDNSTAQQCKSMMTDATTPFMNKSECADESPLNTTKAKVGPNTDEVYLKDSSREEFRKMRRFHFGRCVVKRFQVRVRQDELVRGCHPEVNIHWQMLQKSVGEWGGPRDIRLTDNAQFMDRPFL
ncbi:unnamed protein product [Haemonchus placei]|uniref:Uncharacterized protein n=1 Tax=Haemonchus placei TaxID=6290 RepID=A0A0N4W7L9_HAEPC|nr:unnamed protein product [Haemonchus placei]